MGATLWWGLVPVTAQSRYYTKTGYISFFSKAPLEDIEANTRQTVSFLDVKSGDMVFSVPMKSFQFRKSLMQEHFNENYVESDKYPKATFKGKVVNIQNVNLSQDNLYKVLIEGVLTIHGVDRPVRTDGTLEVKNKQLIGKSTFSVTPQEFNIEIPFLVKEHIAKRIDITVNVVYVPYVEKSL
ncbi:YceI family protein [Rufibacter latericius]|uniref:YceI family protein n=1 Tax=Rufibacter latericius TaxID=2487040 RepID=A0A3M9MAU4_9BACT|nr:YceI family protein [Rufibacter latericius]RNI22700.1 YceI family protein [Rufibacter latericius]